MTNKILTLEEKLKVLRRVPQKFTTVLTGSNHFTELVKHCNTNGLLYLARRITPETTFETLPCADQVYTMLKQECFEEEMEKAACALRDAIEKTCADIYIGRICSCEWNNPDYKKVLTRVFNIILPSAQVFAFTSGCDENADIARHLQQHPVDYSNRKVTLDMAWLQQDAEIKAKDLRDPISAALEVPQPLRKRLHVLPYLLPERSEEW